MILGSLISLSLLLVFVQTEWTGVHAGFFSRVPKFDGKDDDVKPAPSGATASMGPDGQLGSIITMDDSVPFVQLSNNNRMPLIGYGVGNLHPQLVTGMVSASMKDTRKIRLIDTAHASGNEDLVAKGIVKGAEKLDRDGPVEVHVVTKVWYTHLGYDRTKLSVTESLDALRAAFDSDKVNLKVHMLLHWPRCFDNIPWMNCDAEEHELPDFVKVAGPDPTKDPDNAWKHSWRALEDIYLSGEFPIASIGVSNFHLNDLESMQQFARVHPHVLQVNVWSLLSDGMLVQYCHKNRIHVQVYNVLNGTVSKPEAAPRAFHYIQKIGYDISKETGYDVTPAQVILAWLVQHGVSVVPRTSNIERLDENSAAALMRVPAFNDFQVETMAHAVEAYLSGNDFESDIHVTVTFHAASDNMMLYWVDADGEETRIAYVPKGETFEETTFPNHTFRTYLASNKDVWVDHSIDANFGDHKDIHVEL